jgi:hypothetical protein
MRGTRVGGIADELQVLRLRAWRFAQDDNVDEEIANR